MTVKQRIIIGVLALTLAVTVFFLVWFLQRPEETPEGLLVYKEAYMRIADQPWQKGRLCHNR